LITAQDPFDCGLAAIILGKLCKLPIEIQLHTDPFSTYFSGILNFVRKELVKFTLPRSQGLLAVSEKLADEVSSRFNYNRSNIMVLPVYIDAEKLLSKQSGAIKVQGQSKTIIVVARLSPEKNVALAIKILAEVRKSTDARLVVVGSGPEADKLKNLAEQLQVSDFVSFEGWRNDVTPYYKGADVFLQTSYFEGYGMALVEAGLNHLPVISTPVGLAGELINGKEIIICPQDDEKQFARSVLSILANPSLSRVLADNLFDRLDRDIKSKQEYMSLIKSHWEKIVSNT
jgi:glycosyltransferase involved in cell wall biosynthesis